MNLKELLEKRAALTKEIYRLRDLIKTENRHFTAEEKSNWDKVNADYDSLSSQIQVAQRAEAVEAQQRESLPSIASLGSGGPTGVERIEGQATEETRELAFRAWYRHQMDEEPAEAELEAAKRLKFNLGIRSLNIPLIPTNIRRRIHEECRSAHHTRHRDIAQRALSGITGLSGALIKYPTSLIEQLEVNMLAFNGVEQVCEVMTTQTGERMQWPTADDTSNSGSQIGENTAVGTSTDPTFGAVFWDAYMFTSNAVLVPFSLLEDAAFQLAPVLGGMLGERLGRITASKATTGTGAGTFKGLVTAAAAGITAASATAIAADELIRLIHTIDPAYRGSGCGFMAHDGIILAWRLLKDAVGRYLWQGGMDSGQPDRLLNYPVTTNQNMQATVATGTVTSLFGQFSKYKIRRVNSIRMYRLQERYRDSDQDGFVAFTRQDGNLLTAGTTPVKKLTQA